MKFNIPDTVEGFKWRLKVSDMLIEWKQAANEGEAYQVMSALLDLDLTSFAQVRGCLPISEYFTEEHERTLKLIIQHGYPMYKIIAIQRGLA